MVLRTGTLTALVLLMGSGCGTDESGGPRAEGTGGLPGVGGSSGTGAAAAAGGSDGFPLGDGFGPVPGKDGSWFVPVWRDEFEGSAVDAARWRVADENPSMDLPFRRNWMPRNVTLEDGALVLTTRRESDGSFSTGAVRTGYYVPVEQWEFGQVFGRFEARIRAPTQLGHWAAFWLYTPEVGNVNGDGRDGTEIDIAEFAYVESDRVNHALHWDGYDANHQSAGEEARGYGVYDGQWHTFTLEWYPDEYVFYVDGIETWRTSEGGVSQVPQYIKLTEEIGHYGVGPDQWGTGPIEGATLPDTTRFDYVRVWAYEAP